MNYYAPGNIVRVPVVFRDALGALADPSTVTFRYRPDGGTQVNYVFGTDAQLVRDSLGNFHVDVTIANYPGILEYRWESTGNPTTAYDGRIGVNHSALAAAA